jgi:Scavenger mRNA decapping enzyme C-term binding
MADFKGGKTVVSPSDLLGGPPTWPKDAKSWDKIVGDSEIIFEDAHVVVFHDPVDEDNESPREEAELRATLLCKKHVHSLMDLGVADEQLSAKILHGIQQAAYRLGLEAKGFEVRAHVYPPMQHRPELAFKLRSGKPPKKGEASDG